MAMPASSAARIRLSRSKSSVRPASIASAVALERAHHFDGFHAHDRHIESHILLRLADFHHHEPLAAGDARGALDGFVRAFHGLDGHAGAVAHHHGLPQIEPRNLLRDCRP